MPAARGNRRHGRRGHPGRGPGAGHRRSATEREDPRRLPEAPGTETGTRRTVGHVQGRADPDHQDGSTTANKSWPTSRPVWDVVVGILLTIGRHALQPAAARKGHESTGFILFEGGARVLLSAIVVLAAWNRRRSFVAFALLFLGTSMGFPFALPFWALGVWMIFRVLKWQRELAAMTGSDRSRHARPRTRRTRGPGTRRGRGAPAGPGRTDGGSHRRRPTGQEATGTHGTAAEQALHAAQADTAPATGVLSRSLTPDDGPSGTASGGVITAGGARPPAEPNAAGSGSPGAGAPANGPTAPLRGPAAPRPR